MSKTSNLLARVRVPASSANLGPGFDTLGMALNLYLELDVERSKTIQVVHMDKHMQGLPEDESHLIYKTMADLFAKANQPMPPFRLVIRSQIPLTRGLGSSATAIIAGLLAANELLESPFDQHQLFEIATAKEGHPDNVGASLFGGIIVAQWNGKQVSHIRIQPHANLETLVIIPQYELETSAARTVLPEHISFKDAVFNVSHAALLVAALTSGRTDLMAKVVAPSNPADAKGLLKSAIRDPNPVIVLENEILYGTSGPVPKVDDWLVPIGKARIARPGKDVTIVSYSRGMTYALDAAERLAKEGIEAEVIDLRTLRPLDLETVLESVRKTNRIVTVEESWPVCSVGSEICAQVAMQAFDYLDAPPAKITGADVPMPYAANLERLALPNADQVVEAVKRVLYIA